MITEDLKYDWRIENSCEPGNDYRLVRYIDGAREDHGTYETWDDAEQAACDIEAGEA